MTQRAWTVLVILGVVCFVAILAYDLIAPMPTQRFTGAKHNDDVVQLNRSIRDARTALERAEAEAAEPLWTLKPDEVGPAALERVTDVARRAGVQVSTFRPQRVQREDRITRLGYLVTLEGSYPDVVRFAEDLEDPVDRIAVTAVQISASDGATDRVAATIGLVAYALEPEANPTDG